MFCYAKPTCCRRHRHRRVAAAATAAAEAVFVCVMLCWQTDVSLAEAKEAEYEEDKKSQTWRAAIPTAVSVYLPMPRLPSLNHGSSESPKATDRQVAEPERQQAGTTAVMSTPHDAFFASLTRC